MLFRSPLCVACCEGHLEIVQLLLDRGAYIEHQTSKGLTRPLWIVSSWNEKLQIDQLLLSRGAHTEFEYSKGCTPLCLACHNGHTTIAQLLLDRGASIVHRDDDGLAPLHYALLSQNQDLVYLLVQAVSQEGSDVGLIQQMLPDVFPTQKIVDQNCNTKE